MTTQAITAAGTLAAAAIFAAIFYYLPLWHPDGPAQGQSGYRRVVSISGGAAVAYVFVHLLPELNAAKETFVGATATLGLPFPELRVYGAALLGFMLFYGLEHLVTWSSLRAARTKVQVGVGAGAGEIVLSADEDATEGFHTRVLIGSYALYAFVIAYGMAHTMEAGGGQLALFAIAMGLHFVGVVHGLRRECRRLYDTWGRRLLAAAALAGWAVALLWPLGQGAATTLLGFVAGSVIMNTVTLELPGRKDGRFFAFLAGGISYSAVLLLIAG